LDTSPSPIRVTERVLDTLWAKSSAVGGLPLRLHLLDVCAVCLEVLTRLPERDVLAWSSRFGLHDRIDALRWLPLLVGLHDLGKATPGFQAKWPEGAARSRDAGFPYPIGTADRHDAATRALLPAQLARFGLARQTGQLLADAVAAHHGHGITATEADAFNPIDLPLSAPWPAAQTMLVDELADALGIVEAHPRPVVSVEARGAAWNWLAGLCSFCDWVGSSEEFFDHDRPHRSSRLWFESSRALARTALNRVGWVDLCATRRADHKAASREALRIALPARGIPRPLQRAVDELVYTDQGPALVLIEASMGEGKTEAAFVAHVRLGHRGLYVAMPTQATSNALYGRVAEFLSRLRSGTTVHLQLLHAGSRLDDVRLRLRDVGFGTDDASVHVSSWFIGSRRGLLADHAVGTVDQALVSVLNARHAFVRMFGLSDRLVVLDEVHAYDDYTGSLIERLVAWLAALRCSVIVMSATLPAAKRDALVRAWRPDARAQPTAYPRVTVVDSRGLRSATFASARHYVVRTQAAPSGIVDIAALAVRLVREGGCALIVANTVARAQQIYTELRSCGAVEVLLFHARFPFEDRLARERVAVTRFGPGPGDRDRVVLVATQVIEQSLDVDFDVLLTDLAPIDLLLQRIGRLHRHQRSRPAALGSPVVHLCGLGTSGVPDPESRKVYDPWPVLRSVARLREMDAIELPADIDPLVQHVYGDEPTRSADPPLLEALERAEARYRRDKATQSELAALSSLPEPHEWGVGIQATRVDDGAAEIAGPGGATRLGDPSMLVVPVFDLGDRWGVAIDPPLCWPKAQSVPELAAQRLANRYIRLRSVDARDAGAGRELPAGWSGQPALVRLSPLLLDPQGRCSGERVAMTLDPDLGLIVERKSR
jgi:CRISPR-associated endonuclease/helicase Cas3